jgi:parvulin-like peptidyl-prolyl isomerase
LAAANARVIMKTRICLLTLVMSSCVSREVPRSERIVVDIGGHAITVGEFDRFVEGSVHQDEPFLAGDVMEALFEQFIEEQLLLKAADDAGVSADPKTVARRVELINKAQEPKPRNGASTESTLNAVVERQIRIEKLVESRLLNEVTVTDPEVEAHFQANRALFQRPETVSFSQILVEDQQLADELVQQLKRDPSRFAELAKEHSIGPEASRGGKLGGFARGELPLSIEEAVFAVLEGRRSDVVITDFGFHIFEVHEKTATESLALDDVRDTIRVELLRKKSEIKLARYIDELKQTYPVNVHREHLNFAFLDWEDGKIAGPTTEVSP